MRGSVYHQTANLVKVIFVEGAKKRNEPTLIMNTINV